MSTHTFCFIALMKSVTQNIRGDTERHCLSKEFLSQQKIRHLAQLLQSIIHSYSNTICYWKIAKRRTMDARELHAALRTVFENHCPTSNTTPASCNAQP